MISSDQRSLLTLCASRHEDKHLDWSLIARESLRPNGIDALLAGEVLETSPAADQARHLPPLMLKERTRTEDRVGEELQLADTVGARLVTVIDDDYPTNLLLVPNLPPFLFVRGNLRFDDARSVAVVGTRQASAIGLARAGRLARELASKGVTVVSGLAAGIDTAGHRAALAEGGRTSPSSVPGSSAAIQARTRALSRTSSTPAAPSSPSSGRAPDRPSTPSPAATL